MTEPNDLLENLGWINDQLAASPAWRHGPLGSFTRRRIGVGFGLSGHVERLTGTADAGPVTVVVKVEAVEKIRRALAVREAMGVAMGESIAACYGSHLGEHHGVLLLEDISPAAQGDELAGCDRDVAIALIQLVAQLHAQVPPPPTDHDDVWITVPFDDARWSDRVGRLFDRHGSAFGTSDQRRVSAARGRVVAAASTLSGWDRSWIHVDPHLDNILVRPDGSVVLLDWSNARSGPPVVDVGVLVFNLAFSDLVPVTADEVLDIYTAHLSLLGSPVSRETLVEGVTHVLACQVQGTVGWTGSPSVDDTTPRVAHLRAGLPARIVAALNWLDEMKPGSN